MTKKKILVLAVLACVLALGVAAATWAFDPVPTVVFDAAAKTFSFQNCQEYTYGDENGDGVAESYPDLFPNIKNAMPGDSFTQTIRVKVINAGSVFLGKYACESAGDYASGTNHTLPTHGYALAYNGVNLDSYNRKITFQHLSKEGIRSIGKAVVTMAENEQLEAHANAMRLRVESLGER